MVLAHYCVDLETEGGVWLGHYLGERGFEDLGVYDYNYQKERRIPKNWKKNYEEKNKFEGYVQFIQSFSSEAYSSNRQTSVFKSERLIFLWNPPDFRTSSAKL